MGKRNNSYLDSISCCSFEKNGFQVELFDATFFSNWSDNEIGYNTKNNQYKPSNYQDYVKFNKEDVFDELERKIKEYKPDIIFWSALSSHIHGEENM